VFGQIHYLPKIAMTDKLECLYKSLGDFQESSPWSNVMKLSLFVIYNGKTRLISEKSCIALIIPS
jgi:hypothetical protein